MAQINRPSLRFRFHLQIYKIEFSSSNNQGLYVNITRKLCLMAKELFRSETINVTIFLRDF